VSITDVLLHSTEMSDSALKQQADTLIILTGDNIFIHSTQLTTHHDFAIFLWE
jgi:hypothetical protein